MSSKSIMELIEGIYRNYNFTIWQCVEDMISTGKIMMDDLKKDRSLKRLDWMSIEQHATLPEVRNLAKQKVSG